ncbi:MAG: hypothetical protein ACMUIG_01135 [Thermoplasmatota archaeon]
MKRKTYGLSMAGAVLAILFTTLIMIPSASAADILIDESTTSWTPDEPTTDEQVTITVDMVFVDSEPADDKVVLKYALCTDNTCTLDSTVVMERVGTTNQWKAVIGPFDATHTDGDPYKDIKFHFEAEGTATDGGSDPDKVTTATEYIYFNVTGNQDPPDDDDTNGGDDDDKDSPLGIEWIAAVIVILVLFYVRRRRSS